VVNLEQEQVFVFVVTLIRSGNGPLIVVDGVLDGGDVSTGSDIGLGGSSARNPLNFIIK
jgi:hypothetical protein